MCEPITMIAIGTAATIVGGVVSADQQQQAGRREQEYLNYLADEAEEQIGEVRQARAVERRLITENASRESASFRQQVESLQGTQRATAAAQGLSFGSVTAEDIANDTVNRAVMDEMYIRYNADVQKYMSQQEEEASVRDLERRAQGYRMGGANAAAAGGANATTTLLGTAGQVANNWGSYYLYNQRGNRGV